MLSFCLIFNPDSVLTRVADVNVSTEHVAVQSCDEVVKGLAPSDMITWERPLGTVHLSQSGKRQLTFKSPTLAAEQPYHCSLEGQSIQRLLTPNNNGLHRSRRSALSK